MSTLEFEITRVDCKCNSIVLNIIFRTFRGGVNRAESSLHNQKLVAYLPSSVAQSDAPSDWKPEDRGFKPRRGRQHSFVEIDHEIFSTVILSLPLYQEGKLSGGKNVHNTG